MLVLVMLGYHSLSTYLTDMKKAIVRTFSTLLPSVMVKFAYQQLTNPQQRKLRANEVQTLDKAQKEIFSFKGFDIQTYYWPGGPNKVLLIHGWEGQAGNFSDIIERLLVEGFSVYAFDGPSHGFSSKGKTSLFEFNELVGEMIKRSDSKNLISHSFGGVATTYSLYTNPSIAIDKYLLLTTPDRFLDRIEDISRQVGISNQVKLRLIDRLEKEIDLEVASLNVSDFVQALNVKEALIIHDKNDKVIPISQSKGVQAKWPNCELLEIEGTGHFRILRTDFVIDKAIDFFLL